jgi:hypothetical protein
MIDLDRMAEISAGAKRAAEAVWAEDVDERREILDAALELVRANEAAHMAPGQRELILALGRLLVETHLARMDEAAGRA